MRVLAQNLLLRHYPRLLRIPRHLSLLQDLYRQSLVVREYLNTKQLFFYSLDEILEILHIPHIRTAADQTLLQALPVPGVMELVMRMANE